MAVCGRAMSCNIKTPFSSSPWCLLQSDGFHLSHISQYQALFTAVHLSYDVPVLALVNTKKNTTTTLLAVGRILNFLLTSNFRCCHSILLVFYRWIVVLVVHPHSVPKEDV
jgi:hypothetical protein